MTEGFKSKDIFLKAQKKFLGKVTNKKVIKLFIDEQNALLFDNLYKFAKIHVSLFITRFALYLHSIVNTLKNNNFPRKIK